jgi:two-component system, NarL family, sensor kinase
MGVGVSDFAIIFSIATVGMLVLAGSIILFVVFYQKKMIQEQFKRQQLELEYQQKMMEAALESQENERKRLAADLHDSIGAMLSTIRVGITTIAKQLPEPQSLEEPKQMLDDTISSVRRISRDLMPSTLEKFGLVQAVKEMCERFQSTAQMPISCLEQGEVRSIDKKRELMIFRIVQELLNNALKHSRADSILVKMAGTDLLLVSVEDDGVGFDVEAQRLSTQYEKGLGLFNIENRARLLGAKVDFEKERLKGSKITLTIPYEANV